MLHFTVCVSILNCDLDIDRKELQQLRGSGDENLKEQIIQESRLLSLAAFE